MLFLKPSNSMQYHSLLRQAVRLLYFLVALPSVSAIACEYGFTMVFFPSLCAAHYGTN